MKDKNNEKDLEDKEDLNKDDSSTLENGKPKDQKQNQKDDSMKQKGEMDKEKNKECDSQKKNCSNS